MLPSSRTSVLIKLHGIPFERTVKYHKMFVFIGVYESVLHAITVVQNHSDKVPIRVLTIF
jgi:hypothetical protein